MRRGLVLLALTLVIAASVAFACGTELPAPPAATADAGATTTTDAGSDAGDDAPAPPESKVDTFPCGNTTCFFGSQACCLAPAGATCSGVDASCPVDPDAGVTVTTGSPLLCGTYRNCDGGDDCCFTPDGGSRCETSCRNGARNLCILGKDSCRGEDYECVTFSESPSPATTGRCRETD